MSRVFTRSRSTRVASRPSTSPAPIARRRPFNNDETPVAPAGEIEREESPEGYSSTLQFADSTRENRWQRRTVREADGGPNGDDRRRSTSRGSFLGRSRAPIILNASHSGKNDDYVDESEGQTISAPATRPSLDDTYESRLGRRWRSTSRTLREGGNSMSPEPRRGRGDSRSRSQSRYPSGRAARSSSRAPALKKVEDDEDDDRSRSSPIGNKTPKRVDPESPLSDGDTRAPSDTSTKPNASPPLRYPNPLKSFVGRREQGRKPLLPLVQYLPMTLEVWIWAWIGALVPIAAISALFSHANVFAADGPHPTSWASPVIVGSFGASSILLFGAPASPLGQPFAFVGGQVVSAFVGVAVTKLFALNSHYQIADTDQMGSLVWLAGGVAVATALVGMFITNTVHPPGGATALLAATSPPITKLGWRYLIVVLISSGIMLLWALFWMNLGRQAYPGQSWIPPPGPARAHSVWGIFDAVRSKARERKEQLRKETDKELAVK